MIPVNFDKLLRVRPNVVRNANAIVGESVTEHVVHTLKYAACDPAPPPWHGKLSPDGRQQSYGRSLDLHRGSFTCVVDTISHRALHLLYEPQLCSRRAMVGKDRLAGPPNSASERTKPSKPSLVNVTTQGKDPAFRTSPEPATTTTRHASRAKHQHAMPQASRSTNKPSRCESLKALKVHPKQKEKTLWCLLSLRVHMVCAMKCGGGPAQPTYTTIPRGVVYDMACLR